MLNILLNYSVKGLIFFFLPSLFDMIILLFAMLVAKVLTLLSNLLLIR